MNSGDKIDVIATGTGMSKFAQFMESYYTWVCPECCESRDNGMITIRKGIWKCKLCETKVIAVNIYTRMLEKHPNFGNKGR